VSHVSVLLAECPNCGRPLDGGFCAECGQKVTALNPTFHDFFHDLTHELLHVDGKIFRTVRLLLTKPGFLSREYFDGRRARYISPIRLYLIFSVVYFGVSALLSTPLSEQDRAELQRIEAPVRQLGDPEFGAKLEAWTPRVIFLLVPVFALLTSAVTRAAGRNYPHDLYFAFHTHAAVFAFATVWMLLRTTESEIMEAVADLGLLACASWYLVAAFRTAYGGTWPRAVGCAALIGVTYFLAIVMAITAVVLIVLWI
jgi:hypothetical protein